MGTVKEELSGILTVSFEVLAGLGVLPLHSAVRLTGLADYEVEPFIGPGQPGFLPNIGYVIIPNNKPNNDNRVVVATRGRAVQKLTVGAALGIGKLVTVDANGKIIEATFRGAESAFKVFDNVWDGGETVTIEGNVLTEGVDFMTGIDIPTTAQNIANAIDSLPGYRGEVRFGDHVFVRREDDGPNFNNTIIVISTSDDGADIAVDPAWEQEGDISILDPYGVSLTGAAAPDDTAEIMVL